MVIFATASSVPVTAIGCEDPAMPTATSGEASVHISASPEAVYDLVADITRMGERSPECYRAEWVDGPATAAVGARFRGHNRIGVIKWSTTCKVTAADRGREFAFTVVNRHGREETRTYYVCSVPANLPDRGRWKNLTAIGIAINDTVEDGQSRSEVRYYILSRELSAKEFADAVRGHWSIENQLHWQLDVSFREDESRVRTGHAAANLSVIRRFALGMLRRETGCRRGIETKRLKCALSEEYREKVLFNA